jgi:branched-chain amino acid transport system substrate-binding protein
MSGDSRAAIGDALGAGQSRRTVLKSIVATGSMLVSSPMVLRATAQSRPLKIGFVSPQTGPIAAFGAADEFVLAGLRKRLGGGLDIGGVKRDVQIVVKDSQSNPSRASEVTYDLITRDKVDICVATSTADTTNPVADQCEINEMPCITADTPWQAHFFGRKGDPAKGFNWTYHFFWGVEDVIAVFSNMWKSLPTNRIVGTAWENSPDGVALGDKQRGLIPGFEKMGFKIVDTGLFTQMADDFTAQITAFKAADVEIVTGVFVPPAWNTFWTQAAQQNFKPKVATIAKALLFPSAVEALGDRGEGMTTEVWWSPSHPFKSGLTGESSADLAGAYMSATNRQWTQPMGFKHAVVEVACDVLRRAKNVNDAGAVRDAIKTTDYRSIVGPINFQRGPVPNVSKTPLVGGQWKRGTRFKYDLAIVNNETAPNIPTGGKMEPLG